MLDGVAAAEECSWLTQRELPPAFVAGVASAEMEVGGGGGGRRERTLLKEKSLDLINPCP